LVWFILNIQEVKNKMRWLNPFKTCAGYIGVMLTLIWVRPEHLDAAAGQDREFAVAQMPAELAQDADAVMRLVELIFTVEGPGKATQRVRQATTILHEKGREYGKISVGYDKFYQLTSLRGLLLDAQGKKIRELKKSDVTDESAITYFSLYEDNRVRTAELYHDVYPYTVVFEYDVNYNGLISWPDWYPQVYGRPVERSFFEINVPAEMPIRYYLREVKTAPKIATAGNRKILRWEAANLPEWKPEPYSPSWAPAILTAPTAFEIGGYAGDMSSWNLLGKWYYQLCHDRTALPPPALAEAQQLCAAATSPREKARLLYEHLQAKTRYVSVQLGIGGWQPFDPTYVYSRGYGDCKALSNYMVSLLRAVEIEAYPVLILHGESAPEVLADFPSKDFNHVIVCAPMANDTLWLECTSQISPFGHLGAGNENRNVLMVTPEGGKLIRTPKSRAADNRQIRRGVVTLNETGDAKAEVRTLYTGNQQDRVRGALAQSSPLDRENWLRENMGIPSFRLVSADFSAVESKQPEVNLPITLELPRFASRSGTRLFLRPNLMERLTETPPAVKDRKQPVDLDYAFVDTDTISYRLPDSFAVEAMAAPVDIKTPFGRYEASATFREGAVEYVRRLEMRGGLYPANLYEAYRQFRNDIARADNMQIVLVRKTN
jgi:transglutaminase-like putative cysteine protease